MKRELAFALQTQSQLTGSLGRTRASRFQIQGDDLNGVSEDPSSKRIKDCGLNESELKEKSERNGLIDQNQERKVCGGSSCNGITRCRRSSRLNKTDSEFETEIGDKSKCNLVTLNCEDQNKGELAETSIKDDLKYGNKNPSVPMVVDESNGVKNSENKNKNKNNVPVKVPRRFTRSALKSTSNVELVECSLSAAAGSRLFDGDENKSGLNAEVNESSVVSALETPTKKLELKMSKKIALGGKPSSIKELFATGLLEGYSVFYNGGKKGLALRGVVKDIGILCFCSLCKGSRVVSPCRFEIHACKSNRCASYYIYLENGKNLLQVLKACKDSPLETLKETIQSVIGSLPEKEPIICQNCKGSFLATSAEVKQLCESCVVSKNLEASPCDATETDTNARSSKAAFILRSSKSASLCISPQKKSKWKITKKDLRFHKLVFEEGGLPDGTEVAYYSRGQKLLEGYKRGLGIFCRCCNSEVSPSQFEAHAGWASRRKPYGCIYTSNGVSLHEFAISLLKGRKYRAKDSDDLCIICADGGNLLLCDGCPRAFHKECASLSSIPRGKWYCNYCQNKFQREKYVEHNANAVAAGRVSGVDPIEQITKRCIRIVKNPEDSEVVACVLCRGYDFSKSGFGPSTVIVCDQCEKEYHVGCLKKHKMADLKELPKGKWFCCMNCRRISSALQNLLVRGDEKIPDSLLDVIKKKHVDKISDTITDFDVRWRLLSGKIASRETRLLLSNAVAIFHDCFDPIVDLATGRDFIPSMVYGRNIRGQDFGGMYCAVLTVNSFVVSAGIFRVFGQEIAELPLVATCNSNQGKGYFQILFSCIEKLLAFLNVKSLVLPAAYEAESIWTNKFGFEKIPPDQAIHQKPVLKELNLISRCKWLLANRLNTTGIIILCYGSVNRVHKVMQHCLHAAVAKYKRDVAKDKAVEFGLLDYRSFL
ncbi:hypothetical protein TEA_021120 [Camellia sinensis var. sinensis]|uniref:PHD-type domain-containing protein n=1 Tax=Camellia sinensis var. sinensis TaxID=542762 RepID=A0A4S4DBE4_CAMSN|nr:hypothetical protein TEA_021120 [Camellia sinensis var. sinensis]